MTSLCDESDDPSDDKFELVVVVEAPEPAVRARDPVELRAKGTRQQMPLIREPGREPVREPGREPTREPMREKIAHELGREPVRDPVEVLRLWPASTVPAPAPAEPPPRPRPTLRAPSPGPHLDDKIRLAHLALDLYRELEDLQCTAHRAPPVAREHAGACQDPRCVARANALRGALIEACLLVQRAVLMTPGSTSGDEVDDRVRDLLSLIEH